MSKHHLVYVLASVLLLASCARHHHAKGPDASIPINCVTKVVITKVQRCDAISTSLAHCSGEYDVTYACVKYKAAGQ